MSNIPTLASQLASHPPDKIFSTLLDIIIASTPNAQLTKVKPELISFISHPVIKELLEEGDAPALPRPTSSDNLELLKIQDTLSSLTKAIEGLRKANPPSNKQPAPKPSTQKGAGKSPPNPRTFSAIAGSRPPNPSLVLDLAKFGTDKGNRVKLEVLCLSLNEKLGQLSPPQVQLAAVRWTAKGNLIITGGPTSTPQSLQAAAPHISAILPSLLPHITSTHFPQPRANVKWSKILINGVPTGASKDRAPYTPDECHAVLSAINPSYSTLSIMQKPSWVRPPSSYEPDAVSSLSVAFEDPDGSKSKALLAERHLYAFGTRATVKKWKYCQTNKETSKTSAAEHIQSGKSTDEQDVEIHLTSPPLPSTFLARPKHTAATSRPSGPSSPTSTINIPPQRTRSKTRRTGAQG